MESDLDLKIQMLDKSLEQTTNEQLLAEKLVERVKLIEDFQQRAEELGFMLARQTRPQPRCGLATIAEYQKPPPLRRDGQ